MWNENKPEKSQINPKYIRKNKSDTGIGSDEMKELRRKVIEDYYTYKGEKIKSHRVIFDYRERSGEVKTLKPRFKKKSDAEKELTVLVEKHKEANGRFIADKDQILLKEYAEKIHKPYIEETLSPTSHANELSRVNEAVKVFGSRTIASVTRLDIKAYKKHLQKKVAVNAKKIDGKSPTLSIASVNKYLTRFRMMLNEARRDYPGLPEFDFTGDIIQKKLEKKRTKIIDFIEFDRLTTACYGKQAFLNLHCIALWETGARYSEIVGNEKRLDYLPGVKRKDIYLENQRIKLWNSKLHPGLPPSFRIAYLSEFFRDALIDAGIENLEPDELVFRRGDFRDDWDDILERAEIDPEFWQRDMRHCFINNAEDAGVQHSTIQYQVNQAGDNLLERIYINIKDTKLTKKFERFESHSKQQRAEVEASKRNQKATENPIAITTPEPIQTSESPFDFSFLPTFRKESDNPTIEV